MTANIQHVIGYRRKSLQIISIANTNPVLELWEGVYDGEKSQSLELPVEDFLLGTTEEIYQYLSQRHQAQIDENIGQHVAAITRVIELTGYQTYNPAYRYSGNNPPGFLVLSEPSMETAFKEEDLAAVVERCGEILVPENYASLRENGFTCAEGYFLSTVTVLGRTGKLAATKKDIESRSDMEWLTLTKVRYDRKKGERVAKSQKSRAAKLTALTKYDLERFADRLTSVVNSEIGFNSWSNKGLNFCRYSLGTIIKSLDQALGLHKLLFGKFAYRKLSFYQQFILAAGANRAATLKKFEGFEEFHSWLSKELNSRTAKKILSRKTVLQLEQPESRLTTGYDAYLARPDTAKKRRRRSLPPLPDFVRSVRELELVTAEEMLR